MSRKHFNKIAAAIRAIAETHNPELGKMEPQHFLREQAAIGAIGECTRALADIMAADNPLFDRARFLAACGF